MTKEVKKDKDKLKEDIINYIRILKEQHGITITHIAKELQEEHQYIRNLLVGRGRADLILMQKLEKRWPQFLGGESYESLIKKCEGLKMEVDNYKLEKEKKFELIQSLSMRSIEKDDEIKELKSEIKQLKSKIEQLKEENIRTKRF